MRAYRPTYKDKTGKTKQISKWWIELRDCNKHVKRFRGLATREATIELGKKIMRLRDYKIAGLPYDSESMNWISNVPSWVHARLIALGLLSTEHINKRDLLYGTVPPKKLHISAFFYIARTAKEITNHVYKLGIAKEITSHIYKVGIAKQLYKRACGLNNSGPIAIEIIHSVRTRRARCIEQAIKCAFIEQRKQGEWFYFSPEDITTIIQFANDYANK